jgi:hypothetical protein
MLDRLKLFVSAGLMVFALGSLQSCGKCYECSYQVVVEIDDQPVETEATYKEEACSVRERNDWIDQGYTCVSL